MYPERCMMGGRAQIICLKMDGGPVVDSLVFTKW